MKLPFTSRTEPSFVLGALKASRDRADGGRTGGPYAGAASARGRTAAGRRGGWWAAAGVVVGGLLAGLVCFPATWVAHGVASATDGRVQLAEAEGSLWSGSALAVLTGGDGSRDAVVLPSRLGWNVGPLWGGLRVRLTQDCCLSAGLRLELRLGWGHWSLAVLPQDALVGQWPAACLVGLGAPWNTLQPGGQMRLSSFGLTLGGANGQLAMRGRAQIDLVAASSRMVTLEPLGSYRLAISGAAAPTPGSAPPPVAQGADAVTFDLQTLEGALQMNGHGQLNASGLHFRGEARAAPGAESALNNLLNIIGKRNGALSILSIG
jgi:general secretion pathway protein N